MSRSRAALPALLLALSLLAGCATPGPVRPDLWNQYCQAVATTKIPAAKNLARDLVAIVRSTPGLRWNDQGQVLLATLAQDDCKDHGIFCAERAGTPVSLPAEVWLSTVPFLRDFCRALRTPDLNLRLLQRLGMPPSGIPVNVVVQMWVDPRDFFRPCADPGVTGRECSLPPDTGSRDSCPWLRSSHHDHWMCANWKSSYPAACGPGIDPIPFPWTGLGYTWDWAADNPTHHGESELVAPQGTMVTIESATGIGEYCGRQR